MIYSIESGRDLDDPGICQRVCRLKIRVNALLPARRTQICLNATSNDAIRKMLLQHVPMNRIADPDEMAGAVLYLVSDAPPHTPQAPV